MPARLQDSRGDRKFFQSLAEGGFIAAEFHRQTRRAKLEILRPQVVQQALEAIVAERCEVVRIRIEAFETMLRGQFE